VIVSLALLLCATVPVAAQNTVNVALGKTYVCSDPGGLAWKGLLDGEKTSDEPPACFATGNGTGFPKRIVIDLGAVYNISKVVVHSSKNGNTRKVDVWASADGESYAPLRKPYAFPEGEPLAMSAGFPEREARYVKVALWDTYGGGPGGDNVLYLREVEVLGEAKPLSQGDRPRPKLEGAPPRTARMFAHYALTQGAQRRLLIVGDDLAVGGGGGPGLGASVAERLRDDFGLESMEVIEECKPGQTARDAATLPFSSADESPDLIVVALGMADATAFDPVTFRSAVSRLLAKLSERTHAFIVVVLPPRFAHSAELGRADDCSGASTADPAWQLASILEGTEYAGIDADAVLQVAGLDAPSLYADNFTLTETGHKLLAGEIARLFR